MDNPFSLIHTPQPLTLQLLLLPPVLCYGMLWMLTIFILFFNFTLLLLLLLLLLFLEEQ